ncbi:hypothetical protein FB451DRAFT_1287975 [Mycena latifolia]|nr:hypothetical protein FB451DRAFT_1287975 [Mycena latifolia]
MFHSPLHQLRPRYHPPTDRSKRSSFALPSFRRPHRRLILSTVINGLLYLSIFILTRLSVSFRAPRFPSSSLSSHPMTSNWTEFKWQPWIRTASRVISTISLRRHLAPISPLLSRMSLALGHRSPRVYSFIHRWTPCSTSARAAESEMRK